MMTHFSQQILTKSHNFYTHENQFRVHSMNIFNSFEFLLVWKLWIFLRLCCIYLQSSFASIPHLRICFLWLSHTLQISNFLYVFTYALNFLWANKFWFTYLIILWLHFWSFSVKLSILSQKVQYCTEIGIDLASFGRYWNFSHLYWSEIREHWYIKFKLFDRLWSS